MTVSATTTPIAETPVARDRNKDRRIIRIWLYGIAFLVFVMVLVGGATRLTESGLSITEWQPIHGIIPPIGEEQWQEEFLKYQQIPEYQQLNLGMTLSEFKQIYWWEWAHRLLARLVAVAFLLPLIWLWATGRIERALRPQLVGIFLLGGLQGAVGWWMVASGLTERTDVSQYRLATHLIVACLIFAYSIWVARGLVPERPRATYPARGIKIFGAVLIALVFLQLYLGGLVAGLNAGFQNNDWPLMAGQVVPAGMWSEDTWWRNFFENPITAQFFHRIVAYGIAILVVWHAIHLARTMPGSRTTWSSYRVVALVGLQVVLGIATLMSAVPIGLGLAHQGLAILLLAGVIMHRRAMRPPIPIRS